MKWYSMTDEPLKIYGLAVKENGRFYRLPEDIIDQVNETVTGLAKDSAGGRVRFRTDSPVVAVRHVVTKLPLSSANLSFIGKSACDIYVNGVFRGGRPDDINLPQTTRLACIIKKQDEMQDVDIYLPSYNNVLSLEIGVKDGARVEAPRPYAIEKPIVFYGSSITQGSASSRPGICYVSRTARALDADFINLGFAGGARGEQIMADYIASLDMSLFVLDYDHNAPNAEHLEATHYNFYRTVRQAKPDLPILMMTKPDCDGNYTQEAMDENSLRRNIVRATYEKAKAEGDENVRFIDGRTFFGDEDRDSCTADTCHPNDLGFYRMAQTVIPVIREMLRR